jgi:hypothetical protein
MSSAPDGDSAGLEVLFGAYLEARAKIKLKMERGAGTLGICGSQLLVLIDAHRHPGTGLVELCRRTGLKKSAASKLTGALVEAGLLVRTEVEGDRRVIALKASSALLDKGFCSTDSVKSIFPGGARLAGGGERISSLAAALREVSALAER